MNSTQKRRQTPWLAGMAAALFLLLPRAAWSHPAIYGFNFPCWQTDCYQSASAGQSLQALAQTGARWAAVIPTWYMGSAKDSKLGPTRASPSDESVVAAMRRAKALGLLVALKPHVDLENGHPRSDIDPKDAPAWFVNYRAMILHYARLAAQGHADMFVVGTELLHVDGPAHRGDWKRLIAEVRAVYPGPLTYAANSYNFIRVSFWDKLDYIGIDGYFPMPGGDNETLLRLGWEAYKPVIAAMSAAYGKPVLFTEVGISSQKGANLRPWNFGDFGPLDLQVQKAYLQAFLDTFGRDKWCAGFWLWDWEADSRSMGPQDKGQGVRGKPAEKLLENYFKRWRGGQDVAGPPARNISAGGARALGLIRPDAFDGF
ncbi:MAG TPA: hypothetical protein VNH15_00560 [Elusimicrobiota bacterium]|nr:hypothetical protein [Elusimicrobiota bacterium]